MTMTEEEAKSKWCPMVRVHAVYEEQRSNRLDGRHCLICLGSSCAAWRWENPFQQKPSPQTRGYCGLAGKPA